MVSIAEALQIAPQIVGQQQRNNAFRTQQQQQNQIAQLLQNSGVTTSTPLANTLLQVAGITGNPNLLVQAADVDRSQALTDFRNRALAGLTSGAPEGIDPVIQAMLISGDPGQARLASNLLQEQRRSQDLQNQSQVRLQQEQQRIEAEERGEQRKQRENLRRVKVPGFTIQEGIIPSQDDAKKLKTANASAKNIASFVKEMNDIISKSSVQERLKPGKTKRRLKQLFTKLQLQAKNIEELGVLAGPDLDLINSLQVDPTSIANQRFSSEDLVDLNQQIVEFANQQTDNIAGSAGFQREAQQSIDLNQFLK